MEPLNKDKARKAELNLMPCTIKADNARAKIGTYLVIRKPKGEGEVMQSSFRGIEIRGKNFAVPKGYVGVLARERSKAKTHENTWVPTHTFESFGYWNREVEPTEEDSIARWLAFPTISKALLTTVKTDKQSPYDIKRAAASNPIVVDVDDDDDDNNGKEPVKKKSKTNNDKPAPSASASAGVITIQDD